MFRRTIRAPVIKRRLVHIYPSPGIASSSRLSHPLTSISLPIYSSKVGITLQALAIFAQNPFSLDLEMVSRLFDLTIGH
jgi:hypothetical protein